MQNFTGKTVAIMISLLMILAIGGSLAMQDARAQINYTTYAYLNVAPDPVGVGQFVTVDFWLAVPLQSSERAVNLTVVVTPPGGTPITEGPYISDITGGTSFGYTPETPGIYTFEMFYGGQTLKVAPYTGDVEEPSHSPIVSLTVQSTPVSSVPFTPLPTTYWQAPVNAENVQNWAAITGPWLGIYSEPFGSTGSYNDSGNYNPYTTGPTTAHLLWTKQWAIGGVAGGDSGNTETSDYWTTSQYEPKWAPVVIDGIEYSVWYTTDTSYSNGIVAYNLYTGQNMWTINTQNPLVFGMQVDYDVPNQYGVCGPYIVTTGSLPASVTGGVPYATIPGSGQYNLYDGLTGNYVCSIVNGSTPGSGFGGGFMTVDSNGNPVGYYVNLTAGTEIITPNNGGAFGNYAGNPNPPYAFTSTGPTLNCWNMSQALGEGDPNLATSATGEWTLSNKAYPYDAGLEWSVQSIPTTLNGAPIGTAVVQIDGITLGGGLNGGGLSMAEIASNVIVLTYGAGTTQAGGSVGETAGWLIEAGFSLTNGQFLWIDNRTETPYTRLSDNFFYDAADGVYIHLNEATDVMNGYSLNTGDLLWTNTLTGYNGGPTNPIDEYGIQCLVNSGNGEVVFDGLGGDIWCVNMLNGDVIWYTNTTVLTGPSGTETPYGIWPLWVQYNGVWAGQNGLIYLSEGHEYSPPLFHGSQQLCLNATNGDLVWSSLGFDDTGGEVSYGILTTYNSYDAQIYAYGQGPSQTTVSAPDIGVTTATPITITGTVMDVSAGASQQAVKAEFPNGVPCVSDASQTQWMEYVYEQQPEPTNVTGVTVYFTDIDPNGNSYTIGNAVTDSSGVYSFVWTPPIQGSYKIIATFDNTGAYYGSCAETAIYAGAPAATPAPTASPPTGLASTGSLELGIALIAIIIIVIGAIMIVLLLRKRP